ncbi:hypothetical protein VZG28_14375 [Synechococcus elongatus IITB4]|uniref:hypothetical protein n=1 Tax=Synechococcus elongatus TaxID=32046 RepID=UPI0030D55E02
MSFLRLEWSLNHIAIASLGGRCIWAQTPAISQSVETYCCSRGATLGWEYVTPEKLRTISAQSR